MSVVTNIILTCFLDEDEAIAHVSKVLPNTLRSAAESGSPYNAGTKSMQMEVYLAAYNHFDPTNLIAAIQTAPWDYRGSVQLFVCGEHYSRFEELDPFANDALETFIRIAGKVE